MDGSVRYAPSAAKALEVILFIASERPGIDVYHLVKAAFFADKKHVAEYGRPIIGDDYEAAPWGPLPKVVYGLLRGDPIEMIAIGNRGPLPFKVDDAHSVFADRDPNLRRLSDSDIASLRHGIEHVDGKSFDDLVDETHEDPAYLRAKGGHLDYRDFIPDDDPRREEKAAYIAEVARYAVL